MILIETKFIDYKCLQMRLARTRVAESAVCLDAHQPTQHPFILLSSGYDGLQNQVMDPRPPAAAPQAVQRSDFKRSSWFTRSSDFTRSSGFTRSPCEVRGPTRQPACTHSYSTKCTHALVLESQLPHKVVNLLFTITN